MTILSEPLMFYSIIISFSAMKHLCSSDSGFCGAANQDAEMRRA